MSPQTARYIEFRLEVPKAVVDAICDFIIGNICSGLVLEDEDDSPGTVICFYLAEGEASQVDQQISSYLAALPEDLMPGVPELTSRPIAQAEWEEQYRDSVKPIRPADDLFVRPPWFDPDPRAKYDIVIEPRMAFGTGHHETTRSCLQVVREHFATGTRFLDLGCGSGILSILAAKMGAAIVKAVDYDLVAIANCRENFAVNGIQTPADICLGSVEQCDGDLPYDFVCANIITETIVSMLPRLKGLTTDGGILVLSGILDRYQAQLEAALASCDLANYAVLSDNEWRTFTIFKR
ncbi:MAG: 50S ribosomal protein L11 methyltransferase [bacterium]